MCVLYIYMYIYVTVLSECVNCVILIELKVISKITFGFLSLCCACTATVYRQRRSRKFILLYFGRDKNKYRRNKLKTSIFEMYMQYRIHRAAPKFLEKLGWYRMYASLTRRFVTKSDQHTYIDRRLSV